jgi:hypothetical protein
VDASTTEDSEERGSARSGRQRRLHRQRGERGLGSDVAGAGSFLAWVKNHSNSRMGSRGEPPFSRRNGVWRVNLGAHPTLRALVGTLLELSFFAWASIFNYGGLSRGPTGVSLW